MNLDSLNKWLTLTGNVCVVAGVIFLGLELRQNNLLIKFESESSLSSEVSSITDMVIQDSVLVELLGKEESKLTEAERDRLVLLGIRMFMAGESRYIAFETGVNYLDLERSRDIWRGIYTRPRLNYGMPLAWETFAARNRSTFVIWFEQNVIHNQ